jgi:hypothetical protein
MPVRVIVIMPVRVIVVVIVVGIVAGHRSQG